MHTTAVIKFFGSKSAAARALKISQAAVTRWGELVPEKRAVRIERITGGALKYDPVIYDQHKDKCKKGSD
ncbi:MULTISPECIES: Cro/CI family transcriptional regulator [Serratia]|uniref:DNA-binding transcriptional regulator DicC n=1 Tax=Serratia quinivorans TaxID=137545 RepID=A0A379YG99_9GAMM|nr:MULTISPECIES: Cro/CI family transcriptional regulator [Serratia]RYM66282.1 hypothetical protein BSR03_01550 [Serratia proteamaculans]CAI1830265.1 DNA-binding transcriptional regulator DicC [Serratia quinivorans]SUI44185.1 DNA-binding transcriptional regulator DicC [Serratia quinivorans]